MKLNIKTDNMNAPNGWNELLNSVLAAIHQHFLHARILKHQGQMEMADYQYKLSIESMRHADLLIEHMLAEGNMPDLQSMPDAAIATTPAAIAEADKNQARRIQKAIYYLQEHSCEKAATLLNIIYMQNIL